MDILNNPFFILGASVFDPASKLKALTQQKAKSLKSQVLRQTLQTLLDPKQRLHAEIAWVYNFSYAILNKQLQQNLFAYQQSQGITTFVPYSSVDPIADFKGYPCPIKKLKEVADVVWPAYKSLYGVAPNGLGALSAVNILLPLFRFGWKPGALDPRQNLPFDLCVELIQALDNVNLGAIGELINQTRKQAKFPLVTMDELQPVFESHRRYIMQQMLEFFNKLPSLALPEYLNNVELAVLAKGATHLQSRNLSELLGTYENRTYDYFAAQQATLRRTLNYWAIAENDQLPDPQVLYYVNACLKQARGWMQVLKPLNSWVRMHAQAQISQSQAIQDPEQQQKFLQQIQMHHSKVDVLLDLLRNYLSYVPHLGSEIVRYNVFESFKQIFEGDVQCEAVFAEIAQVLKGLEHDELKELQAGLESPIICNYVVEAPLPEGVEPDENRVTLTSKTIEFQQQLLSIKRVLSFWIEKQTDMWVVFVMFEHGVKWRLPFPECLTAFVLVHQLSMVLLEYKFSVWMNRLRSQIPVTFSPVVIHSNQERQLDAAIATMNLWNEGLEFQILPRDPALSTPVDGVEISPKIVRYTWQQIDLKRVAREMSWSVLKIYLKEQDSTYYELRFSVPSFRLLCCLFVAIQDNQNELITEYVKSSEASDSTTTVGQDAAAATSSSYGVNSNTHVAAAANNAATSLDPDAPYTAADSMASMFTSSMATTITQQAERNRVPYGANGTSTQNRAAYDAQPGYRSFAFDSSEPAPAPSNISEQLGVAKGAYSQSKLYTASRSGAYSQSPGAFAYSQ